APLGVRGAGVACDLPYYGARMAVTRYNDSVRYTSRRTHRGAPPAELAAQYRPTGPVFLAPDGSSDRWLTERYCLYTANRRGTVWRGEIHHAPWPLQPAEAEIERNTMTDPLRLALPARPGPLLHFAERQ